MINRMKKLTAAVMKEDIDRLSKELVYLSAVEVSETGETLPSEETGEKIRETEAILAKLSNASSEVARFEGKHRRLLPRTFTRGDFEKLGERSDEILKKADEILAAARTNTDIRADVNKKENEIASLAPWSALDLPLSLEATGTTRVLKGTFPQGTDTDALAETLSAEAGGTLLEVISESTQMIYAVVIVHDAFASAASTILSASGFSKTVFPAGAGNAAEETDRLKNEIASLGTESEKNIASLRELASMREDFEDLSDYYGAKLEKLRVVERAACTQSVCILTGWIPERAVKALEKLMAKFDGYYELADPAEDDDVPVELSNNKFATPFEAIVAMYAYPAYNGYDPTFITGIFYAIIFGMIMQDMGYGLLLMIGCPLLIRLMNAKGSTKKMLRCFFLCGITTFIFGLFFGGFFSDLPMEIAVNIFGVPEDKFPDLALLFNPIDNPMGYLYMAVAVGALHLVCGMLIKAYMLIRDGDVFGAIFDIGSWLVLFCGLGLLLVAPGAGKIVAIVGAAMLVLTQGRHEKNIIMKFLKGLYSLYDTINYLSDLLSYSRIFALGLSGAIIGMVMNILGTLPGKSVVGFITLILVFLLGHALNLALSLLSAFVHTARLQYIEFFGKFYIDGGRPFAPAAVNTKYSEIITEEEK